MRYAVACLAGIVLAAAAAVVVSTYGPESLLDFGEAVYGSDGIYRGLR